MLGRDRGVSQHSSVASRSSSSHVQPNEYLPQPPRKRVSLRAPTDRPEAAASSSRFSSLAPPIQWSGDERLEAEVPPEYEVVDLPDNVIMALDVRDRGSVGCSYYASQEERLYMMEDIRFGGLEAVEARDYNAPAA